MKEVKVFQTFMDENFINIILSIQTSASILSIALIHSEGVWENFLLTVPLSEDQGGTRKSNLGLHI